MNRNQLLEEMEKGKYSRKIIKNSNSDEAILERGRRQKELDDERLAQEKARREEKKREMGLKNTSSKGEIFYAANKLFTHEPQTFGYSI